ncbi:MAG: hypothetical protein SO314_08215 [Alphaproteobacteria bacterium]|nr:hypothetical protein [Alphaproteobacteria bacterium]
MFNACEESEVYGLGDGKSNPVTDIELAEADWTLKNISIDSVAGAKNFTDKGEGRVILLYKDETSKDSSIVWNPTASIEYPTNPVWYVDSQNISQKNVNKVEKTDSVNMKWQQYTFNFENGKSLTLDAKSRIKVLEAHGKKLELPYFEFTKVEFNGVQEYKKLPPEVVDGKEVESYNAILRFLATRSVKQLENSDKVYKVYIPVKLVITKGGDTPVDPTLDKIEADQQKSTFTREYDRQSKYIKYIDTWNWIINQYYNDGSVKQASKKGTINAWFEFPGKQKVYQESLDFSCTSSSSESTGSTSKDFKFTCGGQSFTISSYWEKETYSFGSQTIELPYHYFNNISYNTYKAERQYEKTENGTTYQVYLITISMTASNTSGENEQFNVLYEVWKKKTIDGGGDNPDDPTKDVDAYIKESHLDDNNKSHATITIVDNKGGERDTTVAIQYNISWSLDTDFDVTKADNSVSHQSISNGTSNTSTRTSGAFTIQTIKTVKTSSFNGFSHKITTVNEKATIKVAGKVLTMPSSDLVPVYKSYTQDNPTTADNLVSYPTHLKYDCSYNNKTTSKTQNGVIRVKKEDPKPEEIYDVDAWIKSSDLTDDGLASAIITIRNNKGAERDTSVQVQYNNSWSLDNPFDVTKSDNSVVFSSISSGTSNTSTRTSGAFTIQTIKTVKTSSFNGFSHKITTVNEKATIKVAGKVLTMPSADMTVSYKDYSQDNGTTSNGVTSYPTRLNYTCSYNTGSTSKTQEGTIRVKADEPVTDVDAWFKTQTLTNTGLSSATIVIKNSKGETREENYEIQYQLSWSLANPFEVNKADNSVSHTGISQTNSSSSTYTKGKFTVTTTTKTYKSSFDGFSHSVTTVNETAILHIAGKDLEMLASDLTPSYVNNNQESGSTSGNTTSYLTHLNYSCAYHQGSLGDKTQDVTIKVTKNEPQQPDVVIPSTLGKIIGAQKTIVLKNGNAADRTSCLAIKCERGVFAVIDGTKYTWVGASTSGEVSATSGDGSWHPATIIANGWDKESLAKGWIYQASDGSSSHTQMSAANCNTYAVSDPRLGSYNTNNDGTITIDGTVYGPEL